MIGHRAFLLSVLLAPVAAANRMALMIGMFKACLVAAALLPKLALTPGNAVRGNGTVA
jgi:hypothetical protein